MPKPALTHLPTDVSPQVTVGDQEMVKLVGKGSMKIHTKNEDFGLMYSAFCPYHAHTFHTEPCSRWMAKVEARKAMTARIKEQGEKKAAERAAKYASAGSSSKSGVRF